MSQYVESPCREFPNNAALGQFRRVHMSGGYLALAGAADADGLGQLEAPTLTTDPKGLVRMCNAYGTCKMVAHEAFATAYVGAYAAASGRIATSGTILVGIVLETAGAQGDVIEVLPANAVPALSLARSAITQQDLQVYNIPLDQIKVTGTLDILGASAGTPSGALAITPGTHGSASPKLVGEAASGNQKTDYGRFLFPLPVEYVAGQTVTLRVKARRNGTLTVGGTIDAAVYEGDGAAGVSADLCATAAQTVTASFANYDFTITPTDLLPGDLLDIQLTAFADDTGGTNSKLIEIGAVQLLLDVQG